MKGKKIKTLGVAAMAAITLAIGSGNAFAGGTVTWLNAQYNHGGTSYLLENWLNNSLYLNDLANEAYWTDTKYSDGGWTEVNQYSGHCLDSNYNGQAYTHSCLSGDIYQRWYEISTNTGWCLMDEQTGLVLDAKPTVYTNTNYGDNDWNQRWD